MEQFFSQWGPTAPMFWVRVLWAVAVFVVAFWAANAARRAVGRAVLRTQAPPNVRLFLERMTQLGVLIVGALFAFAILGLDITALASFLGLVSVALSLSLQDILRGMVTGLYLLIERPFQVGDTVEVTGKTGVVEDVGVRATVLRDANGDSVIVPNLTVFTSTIVKKNLFKGNP